AGAPSALDRPKAPTAKAAAAKWTAISSASAPAGESPPMAKSANPPARTIRTAPATNSPAVHPPKAKIALAMLRVSRSAMSRSETKDQKIKIRLDLQKNLPRVPCSCTHEDAQCVLTP